MSTMLTEAKTAGLKVHAEGDELVVRGPRGAGPLALKLLAHKSEILAALEEEDRSAEPTKAPAALMRRNWPLGANSLHHFDLPDRVNTPHSQSWVELFENRRAARKGAGHPLAVAERLAYDETLSRWHLHHHTDPDIWRCPGCSKLVGPDGLDLPDGSRVHFDDLDCLITYGRQWRAEAAQALAQMGLEPPAGWSP